MQPSLIPVLELERRASTRYAISVPVEVDRVGRGITRNISSTGVLFELDTDGLARGASVTFRLSLRTISAPLRCDGRIVRLHPSNGRYAVGATIDACAFE